MLAIQAPRLWSYGCAALALLLATLLRILLDPVLGDRAPFPIYLGAVMLVAWYAGLGPALVTQFGDALLGHYLFVVPRGSLASHDGAALTWLSLYFVGGLLILAVTVSLRNSRARSAVSEERVRLAAQAAAFGTFDIRMATGERFWSPELKAIYGLSPDTPMPADPDGVPLQVHIEDRDRVRQKVLASFEPGGPGEFEDEHRIVRPDGSIRWVLIKGRTVFIGEGANRRPVRLIGAVLDITERKLMEQSLRVSETRLRRQAARLAEVDRRKDEFLAMLAHELRNPLAPIGNALQLLKRGADRPATVTAALGMAERQVEQLVRLVDDLLDIARITRGKVMLRKARVALGVVIQSALETARPHVDAASQRLTLDCPEEPIYLEADLTRMAQAVANLLINAAKYTAAGGHIRLAAYREEPGMNGYEAASRLRQEPTLQDIRLIALTGWGQEAYRQRSHAAGFDHHLVKPVDPAVLEMLLENAGKFVGAGIKNPPARHRERSGWESPGDSHPCTTSL